MEQNSFPWPNVKPSVVIFKELFCCQIKTLMSLSHRTSTHCPVLGQSPSRLLGHTWFFMTAQPGLLLQKTPKHSKKPFTKSMASSLGFGTQQLFQQSCSFNTLVFHDHRWWRFCTICQRWQQDCNTFFSPIPWSFYDEFCVLHTSKEVEWIVSPAPAIWLSRKLRSLHNSIPSCRNSLNSLKPETLGQNTPSITMCYSYVHHSYVAWNSYQRMFCDIFWAFSFIIS